MQISHGRTTRRTATSLVAALALVAASLLGTSAPASAADASVEKDGRKLTSLAGTRPITTTYAEGVIVPVKLERTDPSKSLSGRIYWTRNGEQLTSVAVTSDQSLVYVQDKAFPASMKPGATHDIEIWYCSDDVNEARNGKKCPSGRYKDEKKSEWLKLSNTIKVEKLTPQITISLSNKLLALSDAKSGKKKVNVYAYVSGSGLNGEEAKLEGKMHIYLNDKRVHSADVKQITIPGGSAKKPAISWDIAKSKFTKAGTYKVRVEYEPKNKGAVKFEELVTTAKGQYRSIQIVKD